MSGLRGFNFLTEENVLRRFFKVLQFYETSSCQNVSELMSRFMRMQLRDVCQVESPRQL